MMRSLYSGVAGLKSHQTRMDVIGNNISNVNTVGYKSQRTTFKDSFYQTLSSSSDATASSGGRNAAQVGYGAQLSTIDVLHTNGGYASTGNAMDLYISGNGYFVTLDGNGQELYTRVGVLSFDGSGNLVDGNGNKILGYPMSRYATNVEAKAATFTDAGIELDFGAENAAFFNGYKIRTVTDAAATTPSAVADLGSKTITISSANPITAAQLQTALQSMTAVNGAFPTSVDLTKIVNNGTGTVALDTTFAGVVSGGDSAHAAGDLLFETIPAQSAEISINGVTFNFGAANGAFFNGYRINTVYDDTVADVSAEIDLTNSIITIKAPTNNISTDDLQTALRSMTAKAGTGLIPAGIDTSIIGVDGVTATVLDTGLTTVAATGGADISQSTILDKSNGLQAITKSGALLDTDNDGIYDTESTAVMELTGIKFAENGIITGEDSNGNIIQIGQIVLANVANPSALNLDGNGYLYANGNEGEITYGIPSEGTIGSLVSGGLENSNVDLANEFSDMIITQRGFQANSRIITVSDTMLEELINLKR